MLHLTTADLCDHPTLQARACLAPWRAFGGRAAASGRVATLRTFEDAALLRHHLGTRGEGRILVVDAGGSLRLAVLGDKMAHLAQQNGWAGVLILGAVRDVLALKDMDFAVFALGSVPARAGRQGSGEWGVELSISGTCVGPGDFMAMDADGVVVAAHPPAL